MSDSHELHTLIFIPTFNERENVERMLDELREIYPTVALLFVDDNSPDGTGHILDRRAERDPNLHVIHRKGKEGIGGAHLAGIAWAYEHGVDTLITMDCDFTHVPSDIPALIDRCRGHAIAVGSRYLQAGSLADWNWMRKALTTFGHLLTSRLLGMRYDATGAFRVYNLSRIPRELFGLVEARGYAFFFESLFLLHVNGFAIAEMPILLPARTYGHSKMSVREAARSGMQVLSLHLANSLDPGRFRVGGGVDLDPDLKDPQDWDSYWMAKPAGAHLLYAVVAAIYRSLIIRARLNVAVSKYFHPGDRLLHAGCGSGQVDRDVQHVMKITAIDICPAALGIYQRNNPHAVSVRHASILHLPFPDSSFDGVYNLGVMEHFTDAEIVAILREFARVMKPGGRVVLFWPHRYASSVFVLGTLHWIRRRFLGNDTPLHPKEGSLLRSRRQAEGFLRRSGLRLVDYSFGPRDLFVQAVVVGRKAGDRVELKAEG